MNIPLGRRIFEALTDFQPYKDAQRISIYLAMPSGEVQTDAIVRDALASGKQVFVPYLHKPPLQLPGAPTRVMDMAHLNGVQDYESLKRDAWGIPSIDPTSVGQRQLILGDGDADQQGRGSTLDMILVPGVAFDFDDSGLIRRLGHGKGFYDRFVNRYSSREASKHGHGDPILLYGLALTEQLIPAASDNQIPVDAHDRTLHGVVVGDGRIRESRRRDQDK